MQISDNETQRIFLIRGRTSRCWEGLERSATSFNVCVAVCVRLWVPVYIQTRPARSSVFLSKEKNIAIRSSKQLQLLCLNYVWTCYLLKLINLLCGSRIRKSELRTGYLLERFVWVPWGEIKLDGLIQNQSLHYLQWYGKSLQQSSPTGESTLGYTSCAGWSGPAGNRVEWYVTVCVYVHAHWAAQREWCCVFLASHIRHWVHVWLGIDSCTESFSL